MAWHARTNSQRCDVVNGKGASWSGAMTLGMGWAWLDARIGDNRAHRHIAHQISLALDDACEIGGPSPLRLARGDAALIPAGTLHCLAPVGIAVRTIYVDPMFRGRNSPVAQAGCTRLSRGDASALLAIQDGKQARQWIADFLGLIGSRIIDKRLRARLAESEPGTSPTALAGMIGLSPARLREIAVRDFGVPPSKLPAMAAAATRHRGASSIAQSGRRGRGRWLFRSGTFYASACRMVRGHTRIGA